MNYELKTVDASKAKRPEDVTALLAPYAKQGFSVVAITKDQWVVLQKPKAQ